MNSRLTVRPEITALKTRDNKIVEDDKDIVEVLVDYFSTIYTDYRGEQMPEMQNMTEAELTNIEIASEIVKKKTSTSKLPIILSCSCFYSTPILTYLLWQRKTTV